MVSILKIPKPNPSNILTSSNNYYATVGKILGEITIKTKRDPLGAVTKKPDLDMMTL